MARLSHYLEYLAVRAVAGMAGPLSWEGADRFGVRLGRLAHRFLGSRRRIAIDNLTRALGSQYGADEIERITRRVFENLGRTMVETARLGRYDRQTVERFIVGDGAEHLQAAHEAGKGGIIATAHFGNWELAGSWVVAQGYDIDYLVGIQHNRLVDEFIVDRRQRLGVGIIPAGAGARGVFKALRSNRFVAFACDQHASSGAVVVDFFGRRAAVVQGPAVIAMRVGCPILPFGMRRERHDRHVIIAGEPIYPPRSGNDEEDILTMTRQYTGFFEDYIRQYPDQWMWTHRRWKLDD